jgi:hypothetical protein
MASPKASGTIGLAVLIAATLLATASAMTKPPRRLLGTETGIGGWVSFGAQVHFQQPSTYGSHCNPFHALTPQNFTGNYVDVCYNVPHALIETWAIRFM